MDRQRCEKSIRKWSALVDEHGETDNEWGTAKDGNGDDSDKHKWGLFL